MKFLDENSGRFGAEHVDAAAGGGNALGRRIPAPVRVQRRPRRIQSADVVDAQRRTLPHRPAPQEHVPRRADAEAVVERGRVRRQTHIAHLHTHRRVIHLHRPARWCLQARIPIPLEFQPRRQNRSPFTHPMTIS